MVLVRDVRAGVSMAMALVSAQVHLHAFTLSLVFLLSVWTLATPVSLFAILNASTSLLFLFYCMLKASTLCLLCFSLPEGLYSLSLVPLPS